MLYNYLVEIKNEHPHEQFIYIVADANMQSEHIFEVMNATRARLSDDRYESLQQFNSAEPGLVTGFMKQDNGELRKVLIPRRLFPFPIFILEK